MTLGFRTKILKYRRNYGNSINFLGKLYIKLKFQLCFLGRNMVFQKLPLLYKEATIECDPKMRVNNNKEGRGEGKGR